MYLVEYTKFITVNSFRTQKTGTSIQKRPLNLNLLT